MRIGLFYLHASRQNNSPHSWVLHFILILAISLVINVHMLYNR
uniref:Uncharacterized protein n=1 Tax=Arundo donax TaxID=35708 RepID=A0A0A9E0K4_ARUDO